MKNLINRIEILESKQENGTITMDEQATFVKLCVLASNFLSKKS